MKHQLDFEKPIAELQHKLEELKKHPEKHDLGISLEEETALIERKIEETRRQIFLNLSAWDRIKIARHPKRPFTLDYIQQITGGRPIHAVMGGLHLLSAGAERIGQTIAAFRRWDIQRIIPAHCTGMPAVAQLWAAFPGRCSSCPVGTTLAF